MDAITPPQNLEAEASVLGSMILDSSVVGYLEGSLAPHHFYRESHRKIYAAILQVQREEGIVDLVLINEKLRVSNELDAVGGPMYLLGLAENVPTAAYAEHYAKLVRESWLRRQYISAAQQIMQAAYRSDDPTDISALAEGKLIELSKALTSGSWSSAKQVSDSVIEEYERRKKIIAEGGIPGISTGFADLDRQLGGGYQPGQFVVIAGRPGMAKTALMLSQAQNMAKNGLRSGIFSAEMTPRELGERFITMDRRIDLQQLINPVRISDLTDKMIYQGAANTAELPIHIDQSSGITISELKSRARQLMVQSNGLNVIFVDYIQLLRTTRDMPREQEIGSIGQGLKELAIELDVPVVGLSQLSRKCEERPNKRPMLSDLRESGRIEQDANTVLGLYRDEYYDPQSEDAGVAEVIVMKNRSGPTGTVKLHFNSKSIRFEDLDPRY